MTEKVVWYVVKQYAGQVGIVKLAPHDLRRSCARLCHSAGEELEQIKFLLGHVSVQTTEKYLGCKQRLREAVNDKIGIEPILAEGNVSAGLKITLSKKACLVFDLGNLLWLETVKVALP
jgi:Phage integrase family